MRMFAENQAMATAPARRAFTFETSCRWLGGRSGVIKADDKPPLQVSSSAQFSGDPTKWSPEELLIAAVESCTMATFLALAEQNDLPVAWYASVAEGVLEKVDGTYQITRVTVRPTVALRPGESAELAFRLLQQAREQCFIGNSIVGELWFEPVVETFGD